MLGIFGGVGRSEAGGAGVLPSTSAQRKQQRSESPDKCIVIWSHRSPGMKRVMVGGGSMSV